MPYYLKNNDGQFVAQNFESAFESSFTKDEYEALIFDSMLKANKHKKSWGLEDTWEPIFTTNQSQLIVRKRFVSLKDFSIPA